VSGPPPVPVARVVVGFQGSEEARAALRWAAQEAARWEAALVVVRAWEFSPLVAFTDAPTDPGELRTAIEQATRNDIAEELGGADLERVTVVLREGEPADVLVEVCGHDDLLVIGSRGHRGLKGLLLGSVSHEVALRAPCPVTIVRVPEER
jgi:nucleotide-binding universal stress UspA family protein